MSLRLCFDFISMLCMCLNDTYRPIVCKMKGTLSSLFFAFLLLLKAKKRKNSTSRASNWTLFIKCLNKLEITAMFKEKKSTNGMQEYLIIHKSYDTIYFVDIYVHTHTNKKKRNIQSFCGMMQHRTLHQVFDILKYSHQ